jgi:hypothetical protein
LRKLFGGQQLVGAERHGQKLLQSHDSVLSELVVHEDGGAGLSKQIKSVREKLFRLMILGLQWRGKEKRMSYIAELANELSAHATRAGRRRDVSGDGDGAEIANFGSLLKVP